jgi:hypothetical protein
MRKHLDLEPRLMALTQAELAAERAPRSWIPRSACYFELDPKRWSQRSRAESYWRMANGRIASVH